MKWGTENFSSHLFEKIYCKTIEQHIYETNTNKMQQYLVLQGQKQKQQQSFSRISNIKSLKSYKFKKLKVRQV